VWFLAGTKGGAHIDRECTVPKGKELFFPLLTLVFYNGPTDQPLTEAEKREVLDGILSDRISGLFGTYVCQLLSTVDGVSTLFSALATTRTQSPAFRLAIGADDVYGGTAGTVDTAAVSDGVWVMLRLPKRGTHVLHFEAALCDFESHAVIGGTRQDVTYTLSVE
jgi:hypothetical protein